MTPSTEHGLPAAPPEAAIALVVLNEHGRVLLATPGGDQRKVEELLSRHQRLAALGEMAAALAHQIRTPLAAALLYASNAARAELPVGRRDQLLSKAIGCLHDLEQLISDMLQFARGARFAECDLRLDDLLDSVEASLQPVIGPGQTVTIARPATPITLHGNREALAGAVLNLATNALQAAGEKARVDIATRLVADQLEILVSDNGPGVAPGIRARIFDPFFTSRADGTGLGLAVARSVARAHQGDVTLLDDDARGATFVIRLPAAGANAAAQTHRNAAA